MIIDTDLGPDVDDVLAIAQLRRLLWGSKNDGSTTCSDDSEGPHVIVDGYVGTGQNLMDELEALTWTKQYP